MRQEHLLSNQTEADIASQQPSAAYAYLKSLPPNYDSPVLESYKKARDSRSSIIRSRKTLRMRSGALIPPSISPYPGR